MSSKEIDKFVWVWLRLGCLALCLLGCKLVYSTSIATVEPEKTLKIPVASPTSGSDPFYEERMRMVTDTIEERGVKDPDVLRAMCSVPRHLFVSASYIDQAYDDHPLPIGYGQTISQPYIVAWMTELLELKAGEKVLEIGTGSGYQAAVLAELGFVEVYSLEIVPELAESADERLQSLGYAVHTKQGAGPIQGPSTPSSSPPPPTTCLPHW